MVIKNDKDVYLQPANGKYQAMVDTGLSLGLPTFGGQS